MPPIGSLQSRDISSEARLFCCWRRGKDGWHCGYGIRSSGDGGRWSIGLRELVRTPPHRFGNRQDNVAKAPMRDSKSMRISERWLYVKVRWVHSLLGAQTLRGTLGTPPHARREELTAGLVGRHHAPVRDRSRCCFSTYSTRHSPDNAQRCVELWRDVLLLLRSSIGTSRRTGYRH